MLVVTLFLYFIYNQIIFQRKKNTKTENTEEVSRNMSEKINKNKRIWKKPS